MINIFQNFLYEYTGYTKTIINKKKEKRNQTTSCACEILGKSHNVVVDAVFAKSFS